MDLSIYTIGGVSAIFLVGLIVNLIKGTGKVSSAYLPIVSQFIGISIGLLWAYTTEDSYITGGAIGMVLGAVTSGYYDVLTGIKSTTTTIDSK
ncbi:MAG: hypothetical protein LLF98_01945 [Clostridium sp.]|uniref:hypothetical protein n=1 Tax=Clostridium sp. TaxID=1506 RepID=UPI0025BC40D2|nr:hypothetical protein [Clostridium sp.]MCE5220043.1 hypothetical protein [Clostridium sp.]